MPKCPTNNMEASILIVSYNRKEHLNFTLSILEDYIDYSKHEIKVFLDGCNDNSIELKEVFPKVDWNISSTRLGASRARNVLYNSAKGNILIGLDDDAHPLQKDFIERVIKEFNKDSKIGIIAFQEIKGVFINDQEVLRSKPSELKHYLCKEFYGCGFAIKRDSYKATRGFPVWVDIYGEEACVAIEVLSNNESILYTNEISVNHRVDTEVRKKAKKNYYRFKKQLKNSFNFYLVYYKNPVKSILRLLYHNFTKYAIKDLNFFMNFFKAIFESIIMLPKTLKYRKPVSKEVIKRRIELPPPVFN